MSDIVQWTNLLSQRYALVLSSEGDLDLLLGTRTFVEFLDSDHQSQRYIEEMEQVWDVNYRQWLQNCSEMQKEIAELERRIRETGTKVENAIKDPAQILDRDAFDRSKHILGKIKETDWYQSWNHLTDDIDLNRLHIDRPPQTRTGYMIASRVLGTTRVLARLAEAVETEQEATTQLRTEAEKLWRRYGTAQRRIKNDWLSSGKHALEQLRLVVQIMDGAVFDDPTNLKIPKVKPLIPWMLLLVIYAPSADLKAQAKWWLNQQEASNRNFEKDVDPLIRSYARRVVNELHFLASSCLSEQEPKPEDAHKEIREFKSLVERQIHKDIFVNGTPQENIARAFLQTFLIRRSYREIPVRGGQSDILVFERQGRFLYETKIWRGPKYYEQGLSEIEEYIAGEDDDQNLLDIFYVIFDSTKTRRAEKCRGNAFSTEVLLNRNVNVVIINLQLPQPSRKH